ncbi:tetratricopeptide repeat protein [Actibacterium ureilyticum]|uniref:tetratricopeptide repeat protein n=1 Tax=Actibacterium ureilyticum TaxID=1590614 RepID=UPI000BAAB3F4|nr:tetratricopeptide repeat protein [Actibacterium ureilyticum]
MTSPDDDTAAALDLLRGGAARARSDPARSEAALQQALRLAPQDFDVRLGAYRFYFYNHRYDDALPHCAALIAHAARRLNIAADWRSVGPGDAPFAEAEFAPGLYLQALIAWGYCHLRLGDHDTARAALSKCVALDPGDRFGAAAILGHLHDRLNDSAT